MRNLRIGEDFTIVEGNLKFGVLAMEIVLQAVEIAGTFPLTHREVVEQVIATSLRTRGGYFRLREDPLETFDGQSPHVLHGVGT